jgi:thiosulfate dehydrogenase (quinone) large subunit
MTTNKQQWMAKIRAFSTGPNLAYHTVRLWLGVRALITGIEKFSGKRTVQEPLMDPLTGMEDPSGIMVEVTQKFYALTNNAGVPPSLRTRLMAEPMLPRGLNALFMDAIGPALVALGVLTLLGLWTRVALSLQALLYIALTVGLILLHEDAGISFLGVHIILVTLALWLHDARRAAMPAVVQPAPVSEVSHD